MLTPRYKTILRPVLPLLFAAALGGILFLRLNELRARDPVAGHTVIINEVCAKNLTGFTDPSGHPVPWVELCNVSGQDIDLGGYSLSNDPDLPQQFIFPSGILIPGGANNILLLIADGKNFVDIKKTLHLNFLPHRADETLTLYAPDGSVVDTLHYDELPYDVTYGRRLGDAVSTGYFAAGTPGTQNLTEFRQADPAAVADLGAVTFSVPGGFYADTVQLTLQSPDPDALILYTTDGSEPDLSSPLYTGPITVRSRAGDANQYANQPATLNFSLYSDENWLQNYALRFAPDEVDKCTVVRARVYKNGLLGETISAQSYWVGLAAHTLPVVSLSADPEDLFGLSGIYTPGYTYFNLHRLGQLGNGGNYHSARNINGQLQLFSADGRCLLQDTVRLHISGEFGRSHAQLKNLHVRLDGAPTDVLAQVPGCAALQSFVLRGTGFGSPYPTLHQDAFMNNYLYDQGMGAQYNLPVALYLEGEYWGTYTLRESKNKDFFQRHFAIWPHDLICPGTADHPATNELAFSFGESVDALDCSTPQGLAAAEKLVDTEDFIRYVIAHMYTYNSDGLYNFGNNTIAWRSFSTSSDGPYNDGRWRFLLTDMDATLTNLDGDPFYALLTSDFSFASRADRTMYAVNGNLFQKLWQSQTFRRHFAEVFRREMATTYSPEALLPAWDAWCAQLRPELGRDLPRQRVETTALAPLAQALTGLAPAAQQTDTTAWEASAASVRNFFANRAGIMLDWLEKYEVDPFPD